MFSLSGATKFKYIPNYKDMRGGYDKLRGVVCTLDSRMEEGTAYVFTSRNQIESIPVLNELDQRALALLAKIKSTIY